MKFFKIIEKYDKLCYNVIYYENYSGGAVLENIGVLKVKTMDFQDQVKFVRMHLQLSQEELARQMGISFATVSRWERENRKPQLALLGKFYSFCKRNGIEIDLSDNSNI